MGELARLRQEGKVRHVGVSNFNVEQLERARRIVPSASVQNRYNVADRTSEGVLELCARERIAFIPWRPLALAQGDAASPERQQIEAVAHARGWTVPQASLAWLLGHSEALLPIPGTSNPAHLEELVAAASMRLSL